MMQIDVEVVRSAVGILVSRFASHMVHNTMCAD